jgi:hypothetical protein
MMDSSGGSSVRSILRAILAVMLLLGSGAAGWLPMTEAHEACCCGTPKGIEDTCPCPSPGGSRGTSRGACTERQVVVAAQVASQSEKAQRRLESRPEPEGWELSRAVSCRETGVVFTVRGRDPDLGRHLARLDTLRI